MKPIEPLSGNQRITVPSHLLSPHGGDHYVLRVVGDSMREEGILDGDYVIVLRRTEWTDGEMCVVLVGDEASIKRVSNVHDARGNVLLIGANNREVMYPRDGVRVQGIVVGLMRKC